MDWFALKIAMNRLKMERNGLTLFCGISQGVGSLSVTLHPLIDLLGSFWGVQNGPRKTALCIIKRGEVTDLGARADGGGAAVSLG